MVIDGGVFENYGARTAWELVRRIRGARRARPLDPIVVLISNDAEETAADLRSPRMTQSG